MSYKSIPSELHFIFDRVEDAWHVDPTGVLKALEGLCSQFEVKQNRKVKKQVAASGDEPTPERLAELRRGYGLSSEPSTPIALSAALESDNKLRAGYGLPALATV